MSANFQIPKNRKLDYKFLPSISDVHLLFAPTINESSKQNEWWLSFQPEDRLVTGGTYRIIKRIFDLAFLFLALPLLLPILLTCALFLKLEDPNGPILFKQQRTGINGHRFGMFKFRTMVTNAEEMKVKLMHLNELQYPDFKISNDPRITPVGRFLRKTSLDELPQLLNILKGEMSFVGPRPTSFAADTYSLWHTERLDILPGLTGLWQVSGRSDVEFDDRVRLDIQYIERQSLMFDLMIIWQTFGSVITSKGAY